MAVTVALAVVLAVCLLAAGIIVASRSVQSRAVARQEMAAAELLQEVGRRGLSYYLPETATRVYHLVKEGDDVVGYAAGYLGKSVGVDGSILIRGEQVEYIGRKGVLRSVSWLAANDLSKSHQVERISGLLAGRSRRITQSIVGGVFTGVVEEGHKMIQVANRDVGQGNMVPEGMADVLVSVALSEGGEDGFAFVVPVLQVDGRFVQVQLLVRAGADIPEEIGYDVADGHGGEVVVSGLGTQHVYFNSRRELVWQRGAGGSPVWIAVTRDELINAFPDAVNELARWSERFAGDDAGEGDDNAEW